MVNNVTVASRPADPQEVSLGLEVDDLVMTTTFLREESVDKLIALLKKAKAEAWPKPLKALCPASQELLKYLRKHGDITPIKAREELGIEHLPRRIKDLKEHGFVIRTEVKRGYAGKRYGKYVFNNPEV